ncbi:ATP-binding protein [Candidatus Uabimicrobium amorphum]|uniref:ATP-binding protein n=1 Tax=Uabimicrobium amorphum TaxID=2596890 RepID=UPI00156799C5|nr:ATP-binding protein [Candidatus Uabimicrobium amorphum]
MCRYQDSREQLEERCSEVQNHNIALMNVLPDLLIKISRDGTFLYCTEDHDDLAMNLHDFMGKKITEIFPGNVGKQTMSYIQRALHYKKLQIFEYQIPVPMTSSNMQDYEARIVPCGDDEVFAIIRNITQRKKLENDLVRAKNVSDKTSKAKSEFLATMSHEIRTPMNAVIGVAELLGQTPLDKAQQKYVEMLSSAGKHLLYLVNDILDLSKIESGKFQLQREVFHLKKCVTEIVNIFEISAGEKNLRIDYEFNDNIDIWVVGDCRRVQQILANLINNAIKFTAKGCVTVGVDVNFVKERQVELQFFVKDTGIGIPQDRLTQLFDSFVQLDSSSTREYAGTGLGLAICKRLTQLMNGDISVESKLGVGSTFFFTLQTCIADEGENVGDEKEENSTDFAQLYPCKILLAEDNKVNQLILRNFFSHLGYEIDIVADGEQVIKHSEDNDYDIIFMDIHMPKIDGREATICIRESKSKNPVIIAITADAFDENKRHLLDSGMDDFLSKPITLEELKKVLKTYTPR